MPGAQLELSNVNVSEVTGAVAVGTHLVNAAGTTFNNGSSATLNGTSCFGVLSTGDASPHYPLPVLEGHRRHRPPGRLRQPQRCASCVGDGADLPS